MLDRRLRTYEVYGLTISSEFEIMELRPCQNPSHIDVTVKYAELGLMNPDATQNFSFSEDRQVIVLPLVAAFVIEGSDTVLVEPKPGVSVELLAVPLLGPILAILLHLRGKFVLHGSAISHGGKAYGFVGDKGAGKSTLAAMLLKNPGVQFLTDDLLVVSESLKVLCGYQQLKLSDEALGYSERQKLNVRPPPIEEFPKHQVLLKTYGPIESVPIGGVFELVRGAESKIEDVTLAEAIRILLRFSYISRFPKRAINEHEKQEMFRITTRIAATNRVKRMYVPDGIGALDQVISTLETMP